MNGRRSTRQMPVRQQLNRMTELDALRLQRGLTASEQAEADNLADRAYHRHWRAMQREHGAIIAMRPVTGGFGTNGGAA